jgi:CDP-diacylglycerol--glycerol-3-phosphate 3-phosphatidyltransferase
MKKSEILTLSNFISFVRIFLALPIYHYISVNDIRMAFILIIIAMITDILDGYFARKFNQITNLGKMIDPLADKICILAGFLALTFYKGLPVWVTIVIIGRDFLIIIASIVMIGYKKLVLASNIPGKITVTVMTFLAVIYLLDIEVLKIPFLVLTLLMIIYSFISYTLIFFKNYSAKNES